MKNKLEQLQAGLAMMQLDLTQEQQLQLLAYLDLLSKWNSTYNLTALRNEDLMLSHHILDSLSLLSFLGDAKTMIDVGSGGGMPGIPTAIARPDLKITLLDANSKKTTFLQQVVIELGLSNVTVVCGRVEALLDQDFDVVTSRAFAELKDFVALTTQLVAPTGCWLAMKGVYPYEEISLLPENIYAEDVVKVVVPMLEAERHMVTMKLKA